MSARLRSVRAEALACACSRMRDARMADEFRPPRADSRPASSIALLRHFPKRRFRNSERGVGRRNARVDRDLHEHLLYVIGSRARVARRAHMQIEFLDASERCEYRNCDDAARPQVETGSSPDVAPR